MDKTIRAYFIIVCIMLLTGCVTNDGFKPHNPYSGELSGYTKEITEKINNKKIIAKYDALNGNFIEFTAQYASDGYVSLGWYSWGYLDLDYIYNKSKTITTNLKLLDACKDNQNYIEEIGEYTGFRITCRNGEPYIYWRRSGIYQTFGISYDWTLNEIKMMDNISEKLSTQNYYELKGKL
jgi:hypothetical protein